MTVDECDYTCRDGEELVCEMPYDDSDDVLCFCIKADEAPPYFEDRSIPHTNLGLDPALQPDPPDTSNDYDSGTLVTGSNYGNILVHQPIEKEQVQQHSDPIIQQTRSPSPMQRDPIVVQQPQPIIIREPQAVTQQQPQTIVVPQVQPIIVNTSGDKLETILQQPKPKSIVIQKDEDDGSMKSEPSSMDLEQRGGGGGDDRGGGGSGAIAIAGILSTVQDNLEKAIEQGVAPLRRQNAALEAKLKEQEDLQEQISELESVIATQADHSKSDKEQIERYQNDLQKLKDLQQTSIDKYEGLLEQSENKKKELEDKLLAQKELVERHIKDTGMAKEEENRFREQAEQAQTELKQKITNLESILEMKTSDYEHIEWQKTELQGKLQEKDLLESELQEKTQQLREYIEQNNIQAAEAKRLQEQFESEYATRIEIEKTLKQSQQEKVTMESTLKDRDEELEGLVDQINALEDKQIELLKDNESLQKQIKERIEYTEERVKKAIEELDRKEELEESAKQYMTENQKRALEDQTKNVKSEKKRLLEEEKMVKENALHVIPPDDRDKFMTLQDAIKVVEATIGNKYDTEDLEEALRKKKVEIEEFKNQKGSWWDDFRLKNQKERYEAGKKGRMISKKFEGLRRQERAFESLLGK